MGYLQEHYGDDGVRQVFSGLVNNERYLVADNENPSRLVMKINLSSFLQMRFNLYIFKILGWRITFLYLKILGKLYFFFNRKENWKIKKAVNAVFADRKNRFEIRSITSDVFRGILSHYYEKIFNAYCKSETLQIFFETHIENEGMEAIKQGLSRGKGVLLVTGHYGGVELIPAFLGAQNY
ncbi:unnamed protein product, partial [marine sediment metagenome]